MNHAPMTRLPAEIRSQIASHLLILEYDFWYSHRWYNPDWEERWANEEVLNGNPFFHVTAHDNSILRLRLVSHDWYDTVTELLRDYCWWQIVPGSKNLLKLAEDVCVPKCNFTFPQMVRRLTLNIENVDDYMENTNDDSRKSLMKIFDHLEGIETFCVSFPVIEQQYYLSKRFERNHDEVVEGIAAAFRYGLNSAGFKSLTDLQLEVPCTRDVERFVRNLDDGARSQIKHFYVRIMDSTGEDGAQENGLGLDMEEMDDGEIPSYITPATSKVQARYPNKRHQNCVWQTVASFPNLETLSILGTQYLDLTQLQWERPEFFGGLQALALERVCTNVPSLLQLLKPAPKSGVRPKLNAISFYDVKILGNGGDWSQVFDYLRDNCPNLKCSWLYNLNYHSTHVNYYPNGEHDTQSNIWTRREEDVEGLKSLTRHLVQKAGGFEKYPIECCNRDDDVFEEWLRRENIRY